MLLLDEVIGLVGTRVRRAPGGGVSAATRADGLRRFGIAAQTGRVGGAPAGIAANPATVRSVRAPQAQWQVSMSEPLVRCSSMVWGRQECHRCGICAAYQGSP